MNAPGSSPQYGKGTPLKANLSHESSDGLNIMGSLREEQEEKQRLEKQCFDLKMRIYYLEESLKRFQDGEQVHDAQSENLKVEVSKMRLKLEERAVDLEQRNLLLVKSKNAIDALKTELERLRAESDVHADLEERVHKMKSANDNLESDFNTQVGSLEEKLKSARRTVSSVEEERAKADERSTQLVLSLEHVESHLRDAKSEKQRLAEELAATLLRSRTTEEELAACRAEGQLLRSGGEEGAREREAGRERLRGEQLARLKAEEDFRARFQESGRQYEAQIRSMRGNHEQDLDRLRQEQVDLLADLRADSAEEAARARAEAERHVEEVRESLTQELEKVRESAAVRLGERTEELGGQREAQTATSARCDALQRELEASRAEGRQLIHTGEGLRVEAAARVEELRLLPVLVRDLEEVRAQLHESQATLRGEQGERAKAAARAERADSAAVELRLNLKEAEQQLGASQGEVARLSRETVDLSGRAEGVAGVTRDNERLRSQLGRLETEALGLRHGLSDAHRDLDRAAEAGARTAAEREVARAEALALGGRLASTQGALQTVQGDAQGERERRCAAEAALMETRAVLQQVREELVAEREGRREAEGAQQEGAEEVEDLRRGLGSAVAMCFAALQQWDEALAAVLDGDVFGLLVHDHGGAMAGAAVGAAFAASASGAGAGVGASGWGARQRRLQSQMLQTSPRPTTPGVSADLLLNHSPAGTMGAMGGISNYGASTPAAALAASAAVDLLADPVHLLQRVAVCIERVELKVQRTEKIRKLFHQQAQKMVAKLQEDVHEAHERASLYQHRAADVLVRVEQTQKEAERAGAKRDEETRELQHFKAVVLSQHTEQLRDSDGRHAALGQSLDRERRRADEFERLAESRAEQLRGLQSQSADLREDLGTLERTEQIVAELSARVGELAQANRTLGGECESRGRQLMALGREGNEHLAERAALAARLESLGEAMGARERALGESEDRVRGLLGEVGRLRSRQIHPQLAQTILDTQSLLQEGGGGGMGGMGGGAYSSTAPTSGDLGQHLHHIQSLEHAATELVARTSQAVSAFGSAAGGGRTRGAAAVAELRGEVLDLLDANARLAVQVQQAAGDLRKTASKRFSYASSVGGSAGGGAGGGAGYEGGLDYRRAGLELTSPARADLGAGMVGGVGLGMGTSVGLDVRFESSQRSTYPTSPVSPTQLLASSALRDLTGMGTGIGRVEGGGGGGGGFVHKDERDDRVAYRDRGRESYSRDTHRDAYSQGARRADDSHTHGSNSAHGSGGSSGMGGSNGNSGIGGNGGHKHGSGDPAAPHTPATPSRVSSHRLNKLGCDLEALARKLDSFDTFKPKE
ncbi:hypothetical protein B484DRAFT_397985 [Ochromonadaceae sp. CCMP2298]|nr:hypothetical protein B484DRAFT_397985 [Ochromonadaceae sp. CCMP2298]